MCLRKPGFASALVLCAFLTLEVGGGRRVQLYDGPPVDVWSLGVVLFAMVTGYLPFHAGSNKQELCQKIVNGAFTCPDFISNEVVDLLHRMLTVDPDKRITFSLIMQVCAVPESWFHRTGWWWA